MQTKSTMRAVLVAAAALALITSLLGAPTAQAAGAERVDVIVVFDDSINDSRRASNDVARDHNADVTHVYDHAIEGFSATIPANRLRGLENDRRVASVIEDRPVEAFAEETPTGVSRIDAPAAHAAATGAGVRVAIIDSGIDMDHPDLVGNLAPSGFHKDCANDDDDPDDDNGHGTHVAGTVAAVGNNDEGVIGVAPGAELVGIKVLDHRGSGSWSDVICGIDHVTFLNTNVASPGPVHVANMSLGGSGSASGTCRTTDLATKDPMHAAICSAIDSGAAFTVAAGNDSKDASGFVPAAYPEVITVSAYEDVDGTTASKCTGKFPRRWCGEEFAYFSNYGEIVDVIAPGRAILSTWNDGGYDSISGTSMASPHAAGVAALIVEAQGDPGPEAVATHLRSTGQCPDAEQNAGTGNCTGQGWTNDPDDFTEPMVNAAFAVGTTPSDPDSNGAPTASFTYSCTDLACDFDGTGSTDPDGDPITYSWNFGDGSTATGKTASHTFTSGGDYTVTLTVDDGTATDATGKSVSVTAPPSGGNAAPEASFTYTCTSSTCTFSDTSSDPDGDALSSYHWSFGDGGTSTDANPPAHTYTSNGKHDVVLTVTDSHGATDTMTAGIKCNGKETSCS